MNYRKKTKKHTDMWRLNNILLNNKWFSNEIKEEIKRYFETNENENTNFMRHRQNSSKREIHGYTGLPQEIGKISKKQSNLKPKGTTK